MDQDEQPGGVALANGVVTNGTGPLSRIPDPLPDTISEEIAAYCVVSRFPPHDPTSAAPSDPVRVGRLTSPFPLELIAERFGGGRYRLDWHDKGHRYLGRSKVSMEAPPTEPWQNVRPAGNMQDFRQIPGQMPGPGPYYGAPVNPLDAIMARLGQLEARLVAAPAQPAAAPLTVQDMLGLFQAAATLVKPADPDLMAKYFTTGMRLARDAARGNDDREDSGASGWPAVVSQLAPGILEALNRMVPPGAGQPALPAPAAAVEPAAPRPVQGERNVPKWLQALIEEFRRGIANDDDPGYTADWIVRNVPEQFVGQLCAPDAETTLATYAAIVPELGTDKGRAFSAAVLAELRTDRAAATVGEPAQQE